MLMKIEIEMQALTQKLSTLSSNQTNYSKILQPGKILTIKKKPIAIRTQNNFCFLRLIPLSFNSPLLSAKVIFKSIHLHI